MELPFDIDAFAEAIGLQCSEDSDELSYWSECVVITHAGDMLVFTEWGYSPELALDTVVERGGEILVWPTGRFTSYAVSQKMPWPQTFAEAFAAFVACDWCDLQEREEIEDTYLLLAGQQLGFDLPKLAKPSPTRKKGFRGGESDAHVPCGIWGEPHDPAPSRSQPCGSDDMGYEPQDTTSTRPVCGRSRWWYSRTGARVCQQCHPDALEALQVLADEVKSENTHSERTVNQGPISCRTRSMEPRVGTPLRTSRDMAR